MHMDQQLKNINDERYERDEYFDEREYLKNRKVELWQSLNPELYTIFWYMGLQ